MRLVISILQKIPALDGFISFLERLGLWGYIFTIAIPFLSASVVSIWAKLSSNVPAWGIVIIFISIFALILWTIRMSMDFYESIRNRINPRQHMEFGKELVALSQEICRFLANRQRDQSELHRANPVERPGYDQWQSDRDFEKVTAQLLREQFGSRISGSFARLQKIGISMPPFMISSASYASSGIPQFLGLMGDLLSRGNIEDAITISQNRNFIWQIEH